jgi:hypothetical protein
MKISEISKLEVPPIVADAVSIGVDYAVGRFVIFPILMVFAVLAGVLFGANGTALTLVAIVVGCLLWILVGAISVAKGPEEIVYSSRKVVCVSKNPHMSREVACPCGGVRSGSRRIYFYEQTVNSTGEPVWKCDCCYRETPRS